MDSKPLILIVEDSPVDATLLSLHVKKMGFESIVAETAEKGLAAAVDSCPDVALVDVNLPGIQGVKLLSLFTEFPALKHVPIIFVSADSDPHGLHKALRTGAFTFLTKPVMPDQLERLLRISCAGSRKLREQSIDPDVMAE